MVPYAPGGGATLLARAIQRPLEKELGTKIIVENIAGGSTKVGTMEVLKAKPDGYTFLAFTPEGYVAYYYAQIYDFKIWEKLTLLGNLTIEPWGFVEVRDDSPFKTWADLVRAAKEKPGILTAGGSTSGGMTPLILKRITEIAGVEVQYVPFGGQGPAATALLGGHTDFRICTLPEAMPMVKAGKTRGLAISTDKRLEAIADVPTFKELGIGGSLWCPRGIAGPPNMDPNLVQFITKAIERATKDPEFIKLVENQLFYAVEYRIPDKMMQSAKEYDKEWGPRLAEAYK